jgi:hypothetical protein
MQKAADKTYLSKNKMDKYIQEREKLIKQQKEAEVISGSKLQAIPELKDEQMESMVVEKKEIDLLGMQADQNEEDEQVSSGGEDVEEDDLQEELEVIKPQFFSEQF